MRHADRVGDLQLAAPCETGGDDVLGHPPAGICGRAIDLGRVLAREGAAAVARHPAVGVDDDLAAGQAGVAHRAADLEAPRRVHEHEVAAAHRRVVEQLGRDRDPYHMLQDARAELVHLRSAAVLRGDDHALDAHWLGRSVGVAPVPHRDLCLAVRQQFRKPCRRVARPQDDA